MSPLVLHFFVSCVCSSTTVTFVRRVYINVGWSGWWAVFDLLQKAHSETGNEVTQARLVLCECKGSQPSHHPPFSHLRLLL
ncbi:hypothetical protein JOE21_002780 [Desmospora profundinema]|uniref:Secreted protein n=1 Tax=Desmospora profundinema TaxID=1571184 RepID=A0ABU1IPR3_9BACL|nr:hypothetical protein [Desmospora profundinema]